MATSGRQDTVIWGPTHVSNSKVFCSVENSTSILHFEGIECTEFHIHVALHILCRDNLQHMSDKGRATLGNTL